MTIEEMQKEIEQLEKSRYVKLAMADEKRRLQRKLYKLRYLDKQGRELAAKKGKKEENNDG